VENKKTLLEKEESVLIGQKNFQKSLYMEFLSDIFFS